jgi:hypothetical protein
MIIDKNFVLGYFRKYIFGFIFNDIENCILAKANFAVATILMSNTEYVGALISGNLGLSGHSKSDFNKFLDYFEFNCDSDYYRNFEIEFRDSNKTSKVGIYEAFRCGLIHEYFPKISCIINNNADNVNNFLADDAGIGWIQHSDTKTLRFHTNAFYRDFKKAVDKVYRQVLIQNDPGITVNIENSLNRIFSRALII